MLGPVLKGEINWLVLALDCRRYHEAPAMQAVAEEILSEIRASAPADGRGPVQVPGERERDLWAAAQGQPYTCSNPHRLRHSVALVWS